MIILNFILQNTIVYEMELKSSLNCLNGFNIENYNCEDWKILDPSFSIELPRETLILAEKCVEYKGEVILKQFKIK